MFFNSYSFAGVSIPKPTNNALNTIANSMSHSVKNIAQNKANINITTSKLLDSSELTTGIQNTAAELGLSIDTDSATILAEGDTSSPETIAKVMNNVKENVEGRDDDYVPTLDQDTIVYETEWFALNKVTDQAGANPSTMNSFDYSSDHNVFAEGVDQMVKGKVYVNFKKRDMWADMDLKITLTQATNVAAAEEQQDVSYTSGTATFNSLPIVADEAIRLTTNGNVWGTGMEGEANTLKATNTTITGACSGCSSWWSTKSNMVSEYNHDPSKDGGGTQNAYKAVYIYGKFTTASEGGTALGQIAIEGGHHNDNDDEEGFAATIERQEASGAITGKAYE